MWKYNTTPSASDYLIHYGVKGRSGKKGAGLYYRDGELTEEGKRHYYGDGERRQKGVKTKEEKKAELKSLVKSYHKEMDKASAMTDAADAQWRTAMEARSKMGKTGIGRTINAMKGKSRESKKYSKEYDKASSMSDKADAQTRKAKDLYKKLGKTPISRIINAARYSG